MPQVPCRKRRGLLARQTSPRYAQDMAIAFVFPGQGSREVGMGRELAVQFPAAREVFEEVDAALSQNLSQIMWEGPKETLTLTENAQPALMAVSMAVMRVLEREKGFSITEKV